MSARKNVLPGVEAPKLEFHLHHRQGQAITSPAQEILYGGAAGGGKSHLMRVAAILWAMQIPGLQIYLFRRTTADLYKNHFTGPTSFYALTKPLRDVGLCRIVKSEIRFWQGSRVYLQHCQYEKDVEDFRGYEFHVLMIDEMTTFTERMLRFLQSRMRIPKALAIPPELQGQFPRLLGSTNPGGVGHHYVKSQYVDNGPFNIVRADKENGGRTRVFIPARVSDNPSLDRAEYEATLHGLGDHLLVRAMLDGDWAVVVGSMFGDAWRHHLHTVPPFSIPVEWPLWRGGDDGFAAPAAILWLTEDPDTKTVYVIDTFYKSGMLPDPLADVVLRHDTDITLCYDNGDEEKNARPLSGIYDSAAFADTGQQRPNARANPGPPQKQISRGAAMNVRGCRWRPCEKFPGSRVSGIKHIHQLMGTNPKTGKPFLRIFTTCLDLVRVMPTIQRCKKEPEDIDRDDPDDHLIDALRYSLQYRVGSGFRRMHLAGT